MKIGIIARADNTGLGNQTRQLVAMLNPNKILLINSYFFNRNKQNLEWYKNYECITTEGFASNEEVSKFLDGLDVVLSCEIFYNPNFITLAKRKKVKTFLQYNYEFLDHLSNPTLPLPDVLIAPSLWNYEEVVKKFGHKTKVVYLPPPTDEKQFEEISKININKNHKRVLHVGGKAAIKDRNGTNTVLKMLDYIEGDYEIVIKSQTELPIKISHPKLKLEFNNVLDNTSLYSGFDALILPRRYAGLCLPMNEALLSSMPVFMTNIEPNNKILPIDWLAESNKIDELMTRTMIDIYEADSQKMANILNKYMAMDDKTLLKQSAFWIGYNNFSMTILKDKYLELFNQ